MLAVLSALMPATLPGQEKVLGDYVVSDPQVWSFMKYGGSTPDLYTGTVRAEIPVYNYSDPDFEIPVSLTYASNGYMPNVMANYVGLGWTLSAGGVITRQVQGIRDNEEVYSSSSSHYLQGYYRYVTRIAGQSQYTSVGVLDRDCSGVDVAGGNVSSEVGYAVDGMYYETKSDIYSFSFLGISGKFVILEDGSVKVYDCNVPAGEMRVDLSGLEGAGFKSEIFITTGDGYRYSFGGLVGRYDDVDYDMQVPWGSPAGGGESYIFQSDVWHLSGITAPNGRSVHFGYEMTESWTTTPRGARSGYSFGFSDVGAVGSGHLGGLHYEGSSSWSDYYLELRRHVAQLSYIDVGGCCRIEFTYSDRECEIAHRFNSADHQMNTPPRLSSITVKDVSQGGERILRECTLTHVYGTGNPVMMLSGVRLAGLGEYRMRYHGQNSQFPYQGSLRIDHWGFYNSNSITSISGLIPSVTTDIDYNETIGSASRDPDWTKSMLGMLTRLEYPTGGWTEYEYEPRTYGRIIVRNVTTYGKPILTETTTSDGGGVRVKTVRDHAADGVESVRRYEYGTGNMLSFPRYTHIVHMESGGNGQPHAVYDVDNRSTTTTGYMMDESYIEYGTVTEIHGDSSSVVHHFRNYQDTPDDMSDLAEADTWLGGAHIISNEVVYPDALTAHNFFKDFPSRHAMRGRKDWESHYASDGFLLMHRSFIHDDGATTFIPFVGVTTDCRYEGRVLLPHLDLSGTVTTEYGRDGSVSETRKEYGYNALRQKTSETVDDGSGRILRNNWFYVSSIYPAARTASERHMIATGNVRNPIYLSTSWSDGTDTYLMSATHNVFTQFGPMDKVTAVEEAPASLTPGYLNTIPVDEDFRTRQTVDRYSALGRPVQVTGIDGVPSVILWGYGGLYPVAVIADATVTQLSGSGLTATQDFGWSGLTQAQESALRGTGGRSVTTWQHSPFVGVTRRTDHDGRSTEFTYDSLGRLLVTRGPDGNVTSENIYSPEPISQQ